MRYVTAGTILTIDSDWVMNPTPMLAPAEEPAERTTPESLIYRFSKRPDAGLHQISVKARDFAGMLVAAGLRNAPVYVSIDHDGILDVVKRHRIMRSYPQRGGVCEISRIVCFDAHLDIYPATIVDLDVRDPGKKVIQVAWFEQADNVIARFGLDEHEAGLIREIYDEGEIEKIARLSAWVNIVSNAMGKVKAPLDLTWVVPTHFEKAMDAEFPYQDAQWLVSLEVGRNLGLWKYDLDTRNRQIRIRPNYGADIVVRMRGLDWLRAGKRLSDVTGVHLCLSPRSSAPTVDAWMQELVGELASHCGEIEILGERQRHDR